MNWFGEIPDVSALDNSSKTDLILSLWQMMNSSSAVILLNLLILGLFSFCVFLSHMLFVLLCFVFNVYQFYFSIWFYTISICQLHTKSSVIFLKGVTGRKKSSSTVNPINEWAAAIFSWLYEDVWKVYNLIDDYLHYPLL